MPNPITVSSPSRNVAASGRPVHTYMSAAEAEAEAEDTALFLTQDITNEFGYDPPATREEVLEAVMEVKKTEAEIAVRENASRKRKARINELRRIEVATYERRLTKHEYHDLIHKPRFTKMAKILRDGDRDLRTYAAYDPILGKKFAYDLRAPIKLFLERIKETPL